MQSVKWIGFGVSNALSRTVVHFFPSGGGVTAPYPANCMLNLFSLTVDESIGGLAHKLEEKKIVLEGARLSQPDGVRARRGHARGELVRARDRRQRALLRGPGGRRRRRARAT